MSFSDSSDVLKQIIARPLNNCQSSVSMLKGCVGMVLLAKNHCRRWLVLLISYRSTSSISKFWRYKEGLEGANASHSQMLNTTSPGPSLIFMNTASLNGYTVMKSTYFFKFSTDFQNSLALAGRLLKFCPCVEWQNRTVLQNKWFDIWLTGINHLSLLDWILRQP